ncbi:MAG: hypothetical protein AVDCRST_MAG19-4432 [uncultured Thermomicrobiales bacterium]|uniref:Uncharacterized protein n=1 Tax=uncultured Thermomicrobiales bacterium TaxID=1645740 RepID=A0A6J4VNH2_9BACT|nr:MAG: hypothetical protein AVDCRST_MAG19-4432 [uncultured Thermomicrobiales bacterium]
MGDVLAGLVEPGRRHRFPKGANEVVARLRVDPEARADDRTEVRSMEGTPMDGLDDDA